MRCLRSLFQWTQHWTWGQRAAFRWKLKTMGLWNTFSAVPCIICIVTFWRGLIIFKYSTFRAWKWKKSFLRDSAFFILSKLLSSMNLRRLWKFHTTISFPYRHFVVKTNCSTFQTVFLSRFEYVSFSLSAHFGEVLVSLISFLNLIGNLWLWKGYFGHARPNFYRPWSWN